MYSYDERIKAVKLYFKYHKNNAAVIRELGYPDRQSLYKWVKEYESNGDLRNEFKRKSKYSTEERKVAVNHYLHHGKSINKTIKAIGYPSRYTLSLWLKEDIEGYQSRPVVKSLKEVYTDEEKKKQLWN
jgi:transposase-like protein